LELFHTHRDSVPWLTVILPEFPNEPYLIERHDDVAIDEGPVILAWTFSNTHSTSVWQTDGQPMAIECCISLAN